MNNWQRLKDAFNRVRHNPAFQNMLSSPVTKIMGVNTALFVIVTLRIVILEDQWCALNIFSQALLI